MADCTCTFEWRGWDRAPATPATPHFLTATPHFLTLVCLFLSPLALLRILTMAINTKYPYKRYASEMVGHCGIGSWSRNSKIVLASADNITATFAVEKDLWPVFSHEPTATRAPTGEYVVYFTTTAYGCGKDVPHCVPKCYCPNEQEHGCNPGGPTCFSECTGGITAPSCYDIDEDHRGRSAIRSVLAKNSALFLSMPWAMALPLLSNAIPFGSFPFYSWFLLLSITNIAKHQQCMLTCTCTLDARKSLARPSNTPHPNSTDFQRT